MKTIGISWKPGCWSRWLLVVLLLPLGAQGAAAQEDDVTGGMPQEEPSEYETLFEQTGGPTAPVCGA